MAQEAGAERVLLTNFPDRDLDLIALFEAKVGHIRMRCAKESTDSAA